MTNRLPPGRTDSATPTGQNSASIGAPTYHLINRTSPLPPPEDRLLLWLRSGNTIAFTGGTKLTLAMERHANALPTVWLYYHRGDAKQGISVTAYQPVSMRAEAGCNVVPRAIAVSAAGEPLAVAISIEGVDCPPLEALEACHA